MGIKQEGDVINNFFGPSDPNGKTTFRAIFGNEQGTTIRTILPADLSPQEKKVESGPQRGSGSVIDAHAQTDGGE